MYLHTRGFVGEVLCDGVVALPLGPLKEGLDAVRQVPFALEFDTTSTSAAGANAMRLFLVHSTRRI